MQAIFLRKQQLADNVWEFYIRPSESLDYQPGQYVNVAIPRVHDPRGSGRTFTLTSLPSDDSLSFAVKVPNPCTPYKQALARLEEGAELTIGQAMGDFVLPRDMSRPLVFVAGGLGIASFVGMMKQLAVDGDQRTMRLLYGYRDHEGMLYQNIIESCPGLTTDYFVSPKRITAQDILADHQGNTLYYLSGSEGFTMGLRSDLLQEGTNPTNVVYDFFDGYKPTDF